MRGWQREIRHEILAEGCKCGEAYGKRVTGAPKCDYCLGGCKPDRLDKAAESLKAALESFAHCVSNNLPEVVAALRKVRDDETADDIQKFYNEWTRASGQYAEALSTNNRG